MTVIYIDADACPVKDETLRVADRHKLKVCIVSNGGLRPSPHPLVETVVVPEGPDIADQWIADRATKGDIVITADLPLAAKCLEGGAIVLKHNGAELSADNIGAKLATRDLMADLRASDPYFQNRSRPFSKADRSEFLNALERVIRQIK